MQQTDADIAIERLTAWLRDYGDSKPKEFVGDLSIVLLMAKQARAVIPTDSTTIGFSATTSTETPTGLVKMIAALLLSIAPSASAADLLPLASVPLPPLAIAAVPMPCEATPQGPPTCVRCEGLPDGYRWHYSDGSTIVERYAEYVARGKAPQLTCSTGHCSHPSAGPVKPAGGCRCGCNAATCNCAHSPNVATPTSAQSKNKMMGYDMGIIRLRGG